MEPSGINLDSRRKSAMRSRLSGKAARPQRRFLLMVMLPIWVTWTSLLQGGGQPDITRCVSILVWPRVPWRALPALCRLHGGHGGIYSRRPCNRVRMRFFARPSTPFLDVADEYHAHFSSLLEAENRCSRENWKRSVTNKSAEQLERQGLMARGLRASFIRNEERVVRLRMPRSDTHKKSVHSPLPSALLDHDTVAITQGNMSTTECSAACFIGIVLEAARDSLWVDIQIQKCRSPPNLHVHVTDDEYRPELEEQLDIFTNSSILWRMDTWHNSLPHDRMMDRLRQFTNKSGLPVASAQGLRREILRSFKPNVVSAKAAILANSTAATTQREKGLQRPVVARAYGQARRLVEALLEKRLLNSAQLMAIKRCLKKRLSLIQGPPGTGKTRTACELLMAAVYLKPEDPDNHCGILAVAPSNFAADNLLKGFLGVCQQYGETLKIVRAGVARDEGLQAYSLSKLAANHSAVAHARDLLQRAQLDRKKALKRKLKNKELVPYYVKVSQAWRWLTTVREKIEIEFIRDADVVVSTCSGAGRYAKHNLSFPFVLVDEATQAKEPEVIVPLQYGCDQLVLVGDQNQLPPVVLDAEAAASGLNLSLFERCVKSGMRPRLLTPQYRMHPRIASFVSDSFYRGKLKSNCSFAERRPPCDITWPDGHPIRIVPIRAGRSEVRGSGGKSYVNNEEAMKVLSTVKDLIRHADVEASDIGVISTYAAQVELLIRTFADHSLALEVSTVDGFQGREKDVVLLSTVRNSGRLGFLKDWRRLNVAVSRARRGVVVFGHPRTLASNEHWEALMQCAGFEVH